MIGILLVQFWTKLSFLAYKNCIYVYLKNWDSFTILEHTSENPPRCLLCKPLAKHYIVLYTTIIDQRIFADVIRCSEKRSSTSSKKHTVLTACQLFAPNIRANYKNCTVNHWVSLWECLISMSVSAATSRQVNSSADAEVTHDRCPKIWCISDEFQNNWFPSYKCV